jgi:TPR repeat protein
MLLIVPALGQSAQSASSGLSVCAPRPGEGAHWLAPCEQAANAGDGHAALMVGIMYWNGDGVPRDHPAAAHWFQIADKAGEPRAAKLLGDYAFVRVSQAAKPEDADRTILDEAIGWYEKAIKTDPIAASQAQQRLDMLSHLKQQLSAH